MKKVKDFNEYILVKDNKIPKVGDVAFKQDDWREEYPFIIIEASKNDDKFLLINDVKEKHNVYNLFGFNEKEGFRKFTFSANAFLKSIKIRKNSKKEKQLLESIDKQFSEYILNKQKQIK
jgi:hypothetical protein